MNIELFRNYCLTKKGSNESIPFSKLPSVLVFKVMGKMFTVIDIDEFDSFSIKCVPEEIEELRAKYAAVVPPAYFNPKHWCRVNLDGSITDDQLLEWIDTSYELVVKNLTKKQRVELEEME